MLKIFTTFQRERYREVINVTSLCHEVLRKESFNLLHCLMARNTQRKLVNLFYI